MMDPLRRSFDDLYDTRPPPRGADAVLVGARRQALLGPAPHRRRPGPFVLAAAAAALVLLVVLVTRPSEHTVVETGPAAPGTAAPTTAAPPVATAAPPVTTAAAQDARALPPGRHFGFLLAVDGAARTIEFDEALWLSGEEGNAAARQRGDLGEDDVLPNDFYIVNDDQRRRTLRVGADVTVKVIRQESCCEHTAADFAFLAAAFSSEESLRTLFGAGGSGWVPMWVTIAAAGTVVDIEHQYVP